MFELIEVDYPDFGQAFEPPVFTAADYLPRLARLRERMREERFSHLVIYADREHFANLAWLTGFDPRFEEALLILRPAGEPLILVGNECEAYLPISPLFTEKQLRHEVYQPFSLPDQPRETSRAITEILKSEGVSRGASVGCAGWKTYTTPAEIDLPAYLVDALRSLGAQTLNATGLFNDAARGLRTNATPREIALFEYTNGLASEGMKRVLFGLTLGETDRESLGKAGYEGFPQACHWTAKTGPGRGEFVQPARPKARDRSAVFGQHQLLGRELLPVSVASQERTGLTLGRPRLCTEFRRPVLCRYGRMVQLARSGHARRRTLCGDRPSSAC